MIEFEHVTKRYGQKLAVEDLNLTIPAGQLFALLGPNGAGKTTTIRMLVGLLRPSAGRIRVCGHDVATEPRRAARLLGYVPDEPYLYDKLTGREFLQFVADMFGLNSRDAAANMAREIEQFELGGFVDDLTETYSHGMNQRVAFASALIHDPKVLVIDEPMVGLDPKSMRLVKDLLRAKADAGLCVFMSTHTLGVVEEIADRIGIVHHGHVQLDGELKHLKEELAARQSSLERLFLELTQDHQNGSVKNPQADTRSSARSSGSKP